MSTYAFTVAEPDLAAAVDEWQRGNYGSCFSTLERYAEANHTEAQLILGLAYGTEHWGLPLDRDKAVYWLQRATENGHPLAPLNLAVLFDPTNQLVASNDASTEIADRNYRLAFARCKEGAEAGSAYLMAALANCYSCGWGTEINQGLAESWRARAVAAGYIGQ